MTNRIDLSCPAEIFRTELPTEETPAAVLTLFNLCDRVITSAKRPSGWPSGGGR